MVPTHILKILAYCHSFFVFLDNKLVDDPLEKTVLRELIGYPKQMQKP